MEKDTKTFRTPTGFWHWVVAILGAGMVVFYFYSAGIKAVATEYHRGIYVFATYVLVFLLYPAGTAKTRIGLSLIMGMLLSAFLAVQLVYPVV